MGDIIVSEDSQGRYQAVFTTTGSNTTSTGSTTINVEPAEKSAKNAATQPLRGGGSMGGHDPRANKDPVKRSVRQFGKWANGRFSKCVRVLSKHPNLVARGGGNVNRLCAWLKDQWMHTTKWRHGSRSNLKSKGKKALAKEGAWVESGEATTVPVFGPPSWWDNKEHGDFAEFAEALADMFAAELADEEENGIAKGFERDKPDSVLDSIEDPGEEFEMATASDPEHASTGDDLEGGDDLEVGDDIDSEGDVLDKKETKDPQATKDPDSDAGTDGEGDSGDTSSDSSEAATVSYEAVKNQLDRLLQKQHKQMMAAMAPDSQSPMPSTSSYDNQDSAYAPSTEACYSYICATYDDYFVYKMEPQGWHFKQDYTVDAEGDVAFDGEPVRVNPTFEVVDEPPADQEADPESSSDTMMESESSDDSDSTAGADTADPYAGFKLEGEDTADPYHYNTSAPKDADLNSGTSPASLPPEGHRWVSIDTAGGKSVVVLVNKKSSRITRGPRALVGAKLPPMPRRVALALAAQEDMALSQLAEAAGFDWAACMKEQMKTKKFVDASRACMEAKNKAARSGGDSGQAQSRKEANNGVKAANAVKEAHTGDEEALGTDDATNSGPEAVLVTESDGGGESVEIHEQLMDVSVVVESKKKGDLKTPTGKEVDAIIRVIVPGPGNPADNFYYPADVIKRDIKLIAEGKKMYSDHLTPEEEQKLKGRPRSVKDWTAVVTEAWADNDGVGYGGVKFVDPAFQEKAKRGKEYLGVSIRSAARAKPGQVAGKSYRVIEGFLQGRSVDFVTEAGAGGGFVAVAEANRHKDETIQEEKVDFSKLTLEDLQRERPDLLDSHREAVESLLLEGDGDTDGGANETSEGEATTAEKNYVTMDQLQSMVDQAREAGKAEAQRELSAAKSEARLEQLLAASGLADSSKDIIREGMKGKAFEDEKDADGKVIKPAAQLYEEYAGTMIEKKKAEIKEYMRIPARKAQVTGLGSATATEVESKEADTSSSSTPAGQVNSHIDRLLGIPA